METRFIGIQNNVLFRKLIFPVYPSPSADGSRDNQFAPFRAGVNKLLEIIKKNNEL